MASKIPKIVWPLRDIPMRAVQKGSESILRSAIKLEQIGSIEQFDHLNRGVSSPPAEVLFLGSTNVGKSSLIKALLTSKAKQTTVGEGRTKLPYELPFVSKRPGFTKTLSLYSVGSKLNLIDTPGYGHKSAAEQGGLVSAYLEAPTSKLAKAYLLVSAIKGFSSADLSVLKLLKSQAVNIHVIITKADKIGKSAAQVDANSALLYEDWINWCKLNRYQPTEMYVTSTNPALQYGVTALRGALFENL